MYGRYCRLCRRFPNVPSIQSLPWGVALSALVGSQVNHFCPNFPLCCSISLLPPFAKSMFRRQKTYVWCSNKPPFLFEQHHHLTFHSVWLYLQNRQKAKMNEANRYGGRGPISFLLAFSEPKWKLVFSSCEIREKLMMNANVFQSIRIAFSDRGLSVRNSNGKANKMATEQLAMVNWR